LLRPRYTIDTRNILVIEDRISNLQNRHFMALPAKSLNIRWNKYALLNVLVLIAVLGMLIAVLVWYERRVQRIENEMKKQGLAVVKKEFNS
jgi:hypothetical protein